jgi:hypothetical protein
MPAFRIAAAAALAAAALAGAVTAANAAPAVRQVTCKPHTMSVAGRSAAQIVRGLTTSMPAACGFTVSGNLEGTGFGVDGEWLDGVTTFDGHANLHVVLGFQGVVFDVYRIGTHAWARLYEYSQPTAAPDGNVRAAWESLGVTSSRVIDAAGSTKWVSLTAAQAKLFTVGLTSEIAPFETERSLAAALAAGTGRPWKLSGTEIVDGIHCTVLTDPQDIDGLNLPETLYVNTATGLPVAIRYASEDGTSASTTFGSWSRTRTVTPPPASRVVVG